MGTARVHVCSPYLWIASLDARDDGAACGRPHQGRNI
jgi:hypothetical protein